MKKIQKITISKNDEPALVVERLIDSDANEIVLSIPRFSKLAESLANFHLIKREADFLHKKIIIESVDDKIIELAGLAKLEALNPFFIKSRRQFSDIVVGSKKNNRYTKAEIIEPPPKNKKFFPWPRIKFRLPSVNIVERFPSIKKTVVLFIVVGAVSLGLFLVIKVLPRAEIAIVNQKTEWSYFKSVTADRLAAAVDSENARVPGQVFSYSRGLELSFPATGKKIIEEKAGGTIMIYNAYSSTPQTLIASTRFVAPDGKIFRLFDKLVVPGAEIIEGRIVPSSIKAKIVADKPGEEYNIGPVSKFTIPGFKGTAKYSAFYGESKEPMSGGFIGEAVFPSDADISKARVELSAKLKDMANTELGRQIPNNFKVLNGSMNFIFSKPLVNTAVDKAGNFKISGETQGEVIVFREDDVLLMLLGKVKKEFGEDHAIKGFDLAYGEPRVDFSRDILSFPITFKSIVWRHIDVELLKQKLANKSEGDLRALLFSIPGLESAKISLWPFWVQKAPSNISKIAIIVD